MHDFLISVASGFAVAVLSAIFLRRPSPKGGPSQSMTMNSPRNLGGTQLLLVFLLGFAAALAVYVLM